MPDPALVTRTMAEVAERGQRIVSDFLRRQTVEGAGAANPDPLNIGSAFLEMTTRMMTNPARIVQAQLGFWQDYLTLWQNTARRMMGEDVQPVIAEDPRDRRFKDEAWRENEVFDFIRQSYLLSARFFQNMADQCRRHGREDGAEGGLLHAPIRRRDEPVQLPPDQSGGAAAHRRDRRREPAQGPVAPAERPRARQGQAPHPDVGRRQVPRRREHRGVAGQGRLPERPDAAHPVRADDGIGAEAPAADLPALDQQILHPRPPPQELPRALGGGAGPHRVHGVLGEPRRAPRRQGVRRLHAGGRLRRARRRGEGDRREGRERHRLLPRRHPAGDDAGAHGGAAATTASRARPTSSP